MTVPDTVEVEKGDGYVAMKAGDILMFKAERDWLSRIIAWGTNSRYSHVAVCVAIEATLPEAG